MANPWFKFYGADYLGDIKILQLDANERSCWLTLLCLANQSGSNEIKFLTETQLLSMSGVTQPILGILQKLEQLDMIRVSNGTVTISNWEKRQYSEGYSRVMKFRKRKSNAENTDRTDKNRIDKKRKEEELPDWLNKKAWEAWNIYRKEIKKPLKPTTIRLQLKLLAEHKFDHAQIIKNSITNGWTGLFPLKGNERKPQKYEPPDYGPEINDRRNLLTKQMEKIKNFDSSA